MSVSLFRAGAEGYWPLDSMIKVLERAYEEVEILPPAQEDRDTKYIRVSEKGLNFLALLFNAPEEPEKILQFGFLGLFKGFELSATGAEALNRNLHVSVTEFDDQGNLLLMSMFDAGGAFDEGRFAMILEAWKRDIVMTLKMLTPGLSFKEALSANAIQLLHGKAANEVASGAALNKEKISPQDNKNLEEPLAASFASQTKNGKNQIDYDDKAHANHEHPDEMLARFLGRSDASRALCESCNGRGKTGLIAKKCVPCNGSGLTKSKFA